MSQIQLDQALREKLKFANTSDLAPGSTIRCPDFLLIGPQRTGTTWMSYHLSRHPQIFIPPEKELYYFNNLGDERDEYYTDDRLSWYSQKFIPSRWVFVRKALSNLVKYRIYRPVSLVGEASATYAVMPDELIREIFALNPEAKIIISVRDPVDRSWSHARLQFKWKEKQDLDAIDFREFEAFYRSDLMRRSADYVGLIKRWQSFARPGHVLIKQFNRLEEHPQAFLAELISFLGVWYDQKFFFTNQVGLRIGSVPGKTVPAQHRAFLQKLYADEIRALRDELGITFNDHPS